MPGSIAAVEKTGEKMQEAAEKQRSRFRLGVAWAERCVEESHLDGRGMARGVPLPVITQRRP
jgi:hypothetical protein